MTKNILIKEGDITKASVDAIVNAANPQMLGGGGVDGAIHRAAGPKLLAACKKVKPVNGERCPFGEARITSAGDLCARYVIHTCGPIFSNEKNPAAVLASAYTNCLELAQDNGCASIAFPAISCGVYGYPLYEAGVIAIETCSQDQYASMDIQFYLFGKQILEIWQAIYNRTQPL